MCGLFGVVDTDVKLNKFKKSLELLKHRGPNSEGIWHDDDIVMGHSRLSILDLSDAGKQPMESKDENVVISVNGEIYNYKDIRRELADKYKFKGDSDSEVILHGYAEWGIDKLLDKIDGMYAIVIYDKKEKDMFFVRDRAGIKPLYIYYYDGKLCWSSELQPIEFYIGEQQLTINNTSIYDFLTYGYVPQPKSIYKEVQKVQSAHYLQYSLESQRLDECCYWELTPSNSDVGMEEAKNNIRSILEDSVKEQMVADVSVGCFLSGGVDSAIVCSLANKFEGKLKTFTIGFDNSKRDERRLALVTSNYLKTSHKSKVMSRDDVTEMENKFQKWFHEPFNDTSAYPTFYVSRFVKEDCTVALSGDGGDELFGGYRWFKQYFRYASNKIRFRFLLGSTTFIKSKIQISFLKKAIGLFERFFVLEGFELYCRLLGGMTRHEKKKYEKLLDIPKNYDEYWHFRRFLPKGIHTKKDLQFLDFKTFLPDRVLTKVDRVSMANSLECRIPFLKRELIEYAFSLPESIIYVNNTLKGALHETFKDEVHEDILKAPKSGFGIPGKSWKLSSYANYAHKNENLLLNHFKKFLIKLR